MLDICVNTIVRNGEDFIEPVLKAVIPYVKRVRVGLDSRSSDKTKEILARLGVEVVTREIKNPLVDLVLLRNDLLEGVTERHIWIVDADEYYPPGLCKQLNILINYADVYTFQCHAPWNLTMGHKASAKAQIPRIFRNDGRRWHGVFGKEKLHKKDDYINHIPLRYIHLTHLKKDNWREEMNQKRVADGKSLYDLPEEVIRELTNLSV